MTNKPENPGAFPMYSEVGNLHQEGMTLRDYFAAAALTGMLANPNVSSAIKGDDASEVLATQAFKDADAVLAERSKS